MNKPLVLNEYISNLIETVRKHQLFSDCTDELTYLEKIGVTYEIQMRAEEEDNKTKSPEVSVYALGMQLPPCIIEFLSASKRLLDGYRHGMGVEWDYLFVPQLFETFRDAVYGVRLRPDDEAKVEVRCEGSQVVFRHDGSGEVLKNIDRKTIQKITETLKERAKKFNDLVRDFEIRWNKEMEVADIQSQTLLDILRTAP